MGMGFPPMLAKAYRELREDVFEELESLVPAEMASFRALTIDPCMLKLTCCLSIRFGQFFYASGGSSGLSLDPHF